jgi:D-alanyl-D-alanine carboxypeptidase/D-alanyl-D-alanine-endopeptidase (penicillin-binding protein 4)
MGRFLGALICCSVLSAQSLPDRIDSILDSTEASRRAYWGVRIVDLTDESVIYARNADHFFIPASNTKLLSTALALKRLGPGFRFTTVVLSESAPDGNGRIAGDLRLVGGGDPNLSARILPYVKDEFGPDPLHDIAEMADQVVAKGVRKIDGDIVGDDTAFVYEPFPDGWSVDDAVWEYGAPVSALTLNDNSVSVKITPGAKAGDLATISMSPALDEFVILNRVRTVAAGERRISFERLPGGNELVVRGQIAQNAEAYAQKLGVDDPAVFAARALRSELIKRGVAISGSAVARHRQPDDLTPVAGGHELASHVSHPYIEDLQVTNKESQNLHAELAILQVARAKSGIGSRKAALAEMKTFLQEFGIEPGDYFLRDGSGLSRMTLLTPNLLTKLLIGMYNSPLRDEWVSLLPVGGEDGTLKRRFAANKKAAAAVHAKTGSISHVAALSGYVLPDAGRSYAFSIIANNVNGADNATRALIDKIVLTLVSGI